MAKSNPKYAKYRLRGSIIDPDTEYGPADNTTNPADWSGTNGTNPAYAGPALDEDACGWDSCAGSLGPDVSEGEREVEYQDPSQSPVEPSEVHNKPSIALNLPF